MTELSKQEFKVDSVELKGSNLIEASAGTGKTFSIGILVLRLILEKNLSLPQILMVTFTKAAVAELETRIRKFIREAQAHARDAGVCDAMIQGIVDNSINTIGREEVVSRLRKANSSLDDTAIFTIHSFCQKTLTEFAFETGQLFSAEVIENSAAIVNTAINEYWRQKITTLESRYLQLLVDEKISRDDVATVVSKTLSGKHFVYDKDLDLCKAFEEYFAKSERLEQAANDFDELFENSSERDLKNICQDGDAKKSFSKHSEKPSDFRNELVKKNKKPPKYLNKLFPTLLDSALVFEESMLEARESLKDIKCFLYGEAIADTRQYILKRKQDLNVFTYDDLIQNLAFAVEKDDTGLLKEELQKKYKAVFIDEFQDTDKMQYDIFNQLFSLQSILFYIGDPKQSIYGFRGADIDTYKYAASQVDSSYTMSHNFRSTPNTVAALNSFFKASDNAFCDDKIKYEKVEAGTSLSEMEFQGEAVKNISQIRLKNEKGVDKKIAPAVASEIYHLLSSDYSIEGRKVKPSDIAVLCRKHDQAAEVKVALSKMQIPAVRKDDSKVLQSDEAISVSYVLQACLNPDKANINRALLNRLSTFSKANILTLDDEKELSNFREIKQVWLKSGIYGALSLFLKKYSVGSNLLNSESGSGERAMTNLLQIIELLHKAEVNNKFLPAELISYLQKLIAGAEEDGDEYVQRMESDEDAVQIVLIHGSKGLAYNIVFAPYLDMKNTLGKRTFVEYKDPETEKYCISHFKTDRELELYKKQIEQENRRLIYVCLTRTVYKAYIFTTSKGSVKDFLADQYNCPYIDKLEVKNLSGERYTHNEESIERKARPFNGNLSSSWRMLSFSALNHYHQTYPALKQDSHNEYDTFVFDQLTKGNIAGNFLHELFENADFSQNSFQTVIERVGKRYPSVYQEEYLENYNQLMLRVLQANLSEDKAWCLQQTDKKKMIPELEFFFDINAFTPKEITRLCEKARIEDSRTLEGFMTGFIDLFFEHEGKYYILDWKSNFLGNSLDDYHPDKLDAVMTDNNYHLQYLIYTIALKRYLEMRLPDFNYERDFGGVYYMFLRGCRAGDNTGVFYAKPEKEIIEEMDNLFLAPSAYGGS